MVYVKSVHKIAVTVAASGPITASGVSISRLCRFAGFTDLEESVQRSSTSATPGIALIAALPFADTA